MPQATILISGAGVAGPTLAYWLGRYGYRVVVVESAPDIRRGGQTVDLRGAGADVVERMGLLDTLTQRAVFQRGVAWVRADGSRRAEMPVEAFDGNGVVSKLEILRGDLTDALYTASRSQAEYRFSTRIVELTQHDGGVTAKLNDGSKVQADLVVGADGPHSAVRRLTFGPEEQFIKPLGGYHAWFTAPDRIGLDGWYLMYQAPGGINASIRPSHDAETAKAGLAFRSDPITYDRRDLDAQRQILVERMAGAGWQTDALLAAAVDADDFYFDAFAQVHMDSWSKDRVVLVGDAGYCASPLSGMGTSLALVGAYLLAFQLGPALGPAPDVLTADHLGRALTAYHAKMRPYVDKCQDLPAGIDGYAPMSKSDIAITAQVMKWMQRWPFRSLAAKKFFTTAESIELPDHPPSR